MPLTRVGCCWHKCTSALLILGWGQSINASSFQMLPLVCVLLRVCVLAQCELFGGVRNTVCVHKWG